MFTRHPQGNDTFITIKIVDGMVILVAGFCAAVDRFQPDYALVAWLTL
jgi:preprotein translocase subunit SecE